MNVSVLLRLVSTDRTGGRLAGQAELVETGETTVFADHDEMLVFLRRVSTADDDEASAATDQPALDVGGLNPRPLDIHGAPGF
jgi:hypothetical protein